MSVCGKCNKVIYDDAQCPFINENSIFSNNNWNCEIVNRIRDICKKGENGDTEMVQYTYCEDQKYAVINTYDIYYSEEDNYEESTINLDSSLCLWVSWYKSRGRTEAMWLLDEDNTPKQPTLRELKTIIQYYEKLNII